MVTLVYVIAKHGDDSAAVFYKDGKNIERFRPIPDYGNLEYLTEKLTGQKPEVIYVQQTGQEYPDTLDEIKKWPAHK